MNKFELAEFDVKLEINRICDSFEHEWKSGVQPKIEDYLQDTDVAFCTLLREELEILDLEYRSDIPPKKIGRFEVERLLGEGGHGFVYLCEDPRLNRQVAIKLPRAGTLIDRESFLAEARKLVYLDHPNIVPVYETGTTDEGVPYVVSKYIDGEDLSVQLKNGTISDEEAIRLLHEIAKAIDFIHQRNVIHRDIKPGNILVDRVGTPYLADFGIAKDLESTMTSDGNIRGTLAYMSPEQAEGDSRKVDAKSDIYSLGIVLYEVLCGKLPFTGCMYSLLDQIKNKLPTEPRKIKPTIPRNLQAICMTATAKEPGRRYDNVKQFADDLENIIEGHPVKARRLSVIEKTIWFAKRNPAIVTSMLLLVGLFVTLGFAINYSGGTAATEEPLFEAVVANSKTQTVHITTNPPGARIVFVRLDETNGRPIAGGIFQPEDLTPVQVELEPGLYWIEVEKDGHGFHEVFRKVPDDPEEYRGSYNHLCWTNRSDKTIDLPTIEILNSVNLPKNTAFFSAGIVKHSGRLKKEHVSDFVISCTEVTFREYAISGLLLNPGVKYDDIPNNPVHQVSWDQAVAYAEKVGMRLPSIAEFIYAATNCNTTKYPWGDESGYLDHWFFGPVGKSGYDRTLSEPIVYGLFSNVAEWTMSWLELKLPSHVKPPPALVSSVLDFRVISSGGSSILKIMPDRMENEGGLQKTPFATNKSARQSGLGFRCARSSKPRFLVQ